MSSLTIEELQKIVSISKEPTLTASIAQFRSRKNSRSELNALGKAYGEVAYAFERVRVIVQETNDVDFGDTTPEALMEYITARANEATRALATAESAEDYTEPNKGAQTKKLRWYGASGSGS